MHVSVVNWRLAVTLTVHSVQPASVGTSSLSSALCNCPSFVSNDLFVRQQVCMYCAERLDLIFASQSASGETTMSFYFIFSISLQVFFALSFPLACSSFLQLRGFGKTSHNLSLSFLCALFQRSWKYTEGTFKPMTSSWKQ